MLVSADRAKRLAFIYRPPRKIVPDNIRNDEEEEEREYEVPDYPDASDSDSDDEKCEVCASGRQREFGLLVLCENSDFCHNGRHLLCFERPRSEVPEEQYFCQMCLKYADCAECKTQRQGKSLVRCSNCENVFHEDCLELGSDQIVTSSWRCLSCSCIICGSYNSESTLFSCLSCGEYEHIGCGYVLESLICSRCTFKDYSELPMDPPQFGDETFEVSDDVSLASESTEMDYEDEDGFNNPHSLSFWLDEEPDGSNEYQEIQSKLRHMQVDPKHGFLLISLSMLARGEQHLSSRHWDRIIDAVLHCFKNTESPPELMLRKMIPPQKLSRKLRSLIPAEIIATSMETEYKEKELVFSTVFYHRDPIKVALQLYLSYGSFIGGPLRRVDFSDCSALHACGSRSGQLVQKFLGQNPRFRASDIKLLLQLSSDKAGTNFTHIHPITMTAVNYERDALVRNLDTAMLIVGMVPVRRMLRCYSKSEQRDISLTEAEAMGVNLSPVLAHFKRESYNIILSHLKKLESGVTVNTTGINEPFVCLLHSVVADKEEIGHLLDISNSNVWRCSYCYLWGCGLTEEEINDNPFGLSAQQLRRRSEETDELMRAIVKKEEQKANGDSDFKKEKLIKSAKSFMEAFGVKIDSADPFRKQKIFGLRGSSEYFYPDLLHNADGVVQRLWKMLRMVYGPSLERVSRTLGNTTLGVSDGMSFHKYERTLYDFQFVTLALFVGEREFARSRRSKWIHRLTMLDSHWQLCCAYLEMLYILKDDAVGFLLERLKEVICTFFEHFDKFDEQLQESGLTSGSMKTLKIHEILHFPNAILEVGLFQRTSTNVTEWTHPKSTATIPGIRTEDQSKVLIERNFWAAHFADASCAPSSNQFGRDTEFKPVDQYIIKQLVSKDAIFELRLRSNLRTICSRLKLPSDSISTLDSALTNLFHYTTSIAFGNSIDCSVACTLRKVLCKSVVNFAVPLRSDRDLRVLGFDNSDTTWSEGIGRCTYNEPCKYHAKTSRLFTSFFHASTSLYGIPLIFYKDFLTDSELVVLLRLEEEDMEFQNRSVMRKFNNRYSLHVVETRRIRDSHLAVKYEDDIFVFCGGIRTFNHL